MSSPAGGTGVSRNIESAATCSQPLELQSAAG